MNRYLLVWAGGVLFISTLTGSFWWSMGGGVFFLLLLWGLRGHRSRPPLD